MADRVDADEWKRPLPFISEGLELVYAPLRAREALYDIVFVHDLGADPVEAWTSSRSRTDHNRSKKKYCCWPVDLIPKHFPHARVFMYGYTWSTNISRALEALDYLGSLLLKNVDTIRSRRSQQQPLVFLGHGFGGLVIKAALIRSRSISEAARSMFESTHTIMFFGTPHRKSSNLENDLALADTFDLKLQLLDAWKYDISCRHIMDELSSRFLRICNNGRDKQLCNFHALKMSRQSAEVSISICSRILGLANI